MTRIATRPRCAVFDSELGWIGLVTRSRDVLRLTFGHDGPRAAHRRLELDVDPDEDDAFIEELRQRLLAFASGDRSDRFLDVSLDLTHTTQFQRTVIEQCRQIPPGETCSYGELAGRAGRPRAARAVGTVMRTNRFPLIVPCHRVVAAGGRIGGFSSPDGIDMKRRLLQPEDAVH